MAEEPVMQISATETFFPYSKESLPERSIHKPNMKYIALFLMLANTVLSDEPKLPRPDQVDKPENIKFIVPDKSKLAGIVVDDVEAKLVGEWKHSVHTPPFVGQSYIHDMKEKKGKKSASFTPNLPIASLYEVRISHNSNIRRANGVPITINHR